MNRVVITGIDTSSLPKLSMEQSNELLKQIANGDENAREIFLQANIRLVLSILGRFSTTQENVDDLFQAGMVGLIKSLNNFDPNYGVCFSTYAVPKIAGEIRRFLRDDGAVKVSRGLKERAAAVKNARNQITQVLGREPTIQELSQKTGYTIEEIALAEAATASVESIQQEAGEDGFTLESVLSDTESEDTMLERISLRQAVGKLPEREAMVIRLRFYHGLTQQRVSSVLQVSQVQVSRIEKKALAHLKEYLS